MALNIQSLRNKVEEVELLTNSYSPDFLCISEHWLPSSDTHFSLPHYCTSSIYHRSSSAHGGVAIFAKPHHQTRPIPDLHKWCIDKIIECTGVIWSRPKQVSIAVLSVYRSPAADISNFLLNLEDILTHTTKVSPRAAIVLCGDFNIDLLKPSCSRTKFLDLLHSFHLYETVSTPTRITATTSTLIDNIFTTIGDKLWRLLRVEYRTILAFHLP